MGINNRERITKYDGRGLVLRWGEGCCRSACYFVCGHAPLPDRPTYDYSRSTVSTSSTKNTSYKQQHILQILARQAIATDRQRRELEHLREEYNQELSRKTTQLRYTEAQLYTARDERDKLFSSLERMRAEMSSMRQRGAAPGSIPLDEHRKLLKRVEDMAKNRTAIIEGEKGELVFHMSKLRIELAQLRNQLEEQRFPDDMEAVLTDRVLQAVRSSCIDSASPTLITLMAILNNL